MARWYESNRKLFRQERDALATTCPLMRLAVVGPGFKINSVCGLKQEHAVVHGTYSLHIPDISRPFEYGIVLLIPDNYPKAAPQMFCNDPRLPVENIDRHIMPYGMACLGVQAEIGMRWKAGSTIVAFLDNLVAPFLAWQTYFNDYGEPPPFWAERSHFSQGILEFYAELLGRSVDSTIVGFMRLLARKNQPKGHESCPCNSGMRLRNCHKNLLYEIRQRVAWKDVEYELAIINKPEDEKQSPFYH